MIPLLILADRSWRMSVGFEMIVAITIFAIATVALLPFAKGAVIGFAWAQGVVRSPDRVDDRCNGGTSQRSLPSDRLAPGAKVQIEASRPKRDGNVIRLLDEEIRYRPAGPVLQGEDRDRHGWDQKVRAQRTCGLTLPFAPQG